MFNREKLMENISERLSILQESKGINNASLAKLIGVSAAAVSQFKTKKRLMTLPILCKICCVLGSSVDSMVGYNYQKSKKIGLLTDEINNLKYKRDKMINEVIN